MNDLKLTNTHDLDFSSGDLELLNDDAEVAKQTLKINLLFFQGEWFLDNEYGLPYFQEMLVKGVNKGLVDGIIREATLDSYNIASVTSINSSLGSDRVYSLDQLLAETTSGDIVSVTNLDI